MNFNYKSNDFETMAQCTREIKELKRKLCESLGVNRDQLKLPNGLITLYGYDQETDQYYPLCHYIGDFNDKIKSPTWSSYYLYCDLYTK